IDNSWIALLVLGFVKIILKYVEALVTPNVSVTIAARARLQAAERWGCGINLLECCETLA
ncbi:hypothetical protein, partial [Vibrio parahaemolyticus]|uniref:hypothetical protein n=1 Tax=Vibrio parahaemolyticus TaxID=670 RepID=UPI00211498D8